MRLTSPPRGPEERHARAKEWLPSVWIAGTRVLAVKESQVVDHVKDAWRVGHGGWIVTANVDILRRIARDSEVRALVRRSDLVVADGMPLLWASALSGAPLPERVTGASLFWTLSEAAAAEGRSVFVLGGPPGAAEGAASALANRFPGLRIAGTACPPMGFETTPGGMETLVDQISASSAGLVLIGLGFPKQEHVAVRVMSRLPAAWCLGCGAAVVFASGDAARAPEWMQRSGIEWVHRLSAEPRRLAGRYLRDDAPFTVRLLLSAAAARLRRSRSQGSPAATSVVGHDSNPEGSHEVARWRG
jgi:N-acetylglucosaminyldiphosphoundecaprenol N-acetyl-beta-D-mannosaminyltransferase